MQHQGVHELAGSVACVCIADAGLDIPDDHRSPETHGSNLSAGRVLSIGRDCNARYAVRMTLQKRLGVSLDVPNYYCGSERIQNVLAIRMLD